MSHLLKFCAKYHRSLALFSVTVVCCTLLSGCAGTFLNDAPGVISAVLASLSGILSVIGILVPGGTAITGVVNTVIAEIEEIEKLIQEYKTTPSETLLQKIEQAIQVAITHIQPLLSPVGVPAPAAQKIGAIAQLILSQLEAWSSLFPAAKPAAHGLALESHTITKPLTAAQLKKAINSIVEEKSGDPDTDAAFAKMKKL